MRRCPIYEDRIWPWQGKFGGYHTKCACKAFEDVCAYMAEVVPCVNTVVTQVRQALDDVDRCLSDLRSETEKCLSDLESDAAMQSREVKPSPDSKERFN